MFQETEIAKYRAETISIVVSFEDVLPSGDTISGTPIVTVVVFSGTDNTPSSILYEGISVSGLSIEQRVRLGVIGTIYLITFKVTSSSGAVFEKECYLAILPEDLGATPNFSDVYLTSTLYPLDTQDSYTSNFQSLSGLLLYQPSWQEAYQGGFVSISGALTLARITYNIPPESYQDSLVSISGTLTVGRIRYDNGYDAYQGSITNMSGTLTKGRVRYTNPYDAYQSSMLSIGGTLT